MAKLTARVFTNVRSSSCKVSGIFALLETWILWMGFSTPPPPQCKISGKPVQREPWCSTLADWQETNSRFSQLGERTSKAIILCSYSNTALESSVRKFNGYSVYDPGCDDVCFYQCTSIIKYCKSSVSFRPVKNPAELANGAYSVCEVTKSGLFYKSDSSQSLYYKSLALRLLPEIFIFQKPTHDLH
jgi:hypothetical protein